MEIISTFLPQIGLEKLGKKTRLTAFDTLIDGKSVVVGIAIGNIHKATEENAIGIKVASRVIEHHQFKHPKGAPFIVAEMKVSSTAVKQARDVLRRAPHQSALMFLCTDERVYNEAFAALGVNLSHGENDRV
ncbi:hypothetical protein [Glaciimonas sp. PAMC28666]|uniref:hypothetical protein n=1 Tax=Glaciimonas sp. PAMC28666 TaxID=2807626 RepID=UPI00196580CC|nr:hypothetical protein [Glaciimonas sp. PAMC28666]QRX83588.1 hypothetical protein JQN73_04950 [Glaciimonas sp. PAMC28666]